MGHRERLAGIDRRPPRSALLRHRYRRPLRGTHQPQVRAAARSGCGGRCPLRGTRCAGTSAGCASRSATRRSTRSPTCTPTPRTRRLRLAVKISPNLRWRPGDHRRAPAAAALDHHRREPRCRRVEQAVPGTRQPTQSAAGLVETLHEGEQTQQQLLDVLRGLRGADED